MFESLHKLQRLASEKTAQYRHEADTARTLAAASVRPGWRWRLGEALLTLAARLSPDHRTLLERLCEPLDPRLGDGRATT